MVVLGRHVVEVERPMPARTLGVCTIVVCGGDRPPAEAGQREPLVGRDHRRDLRVGLTDIAHLVDERRDHAPVLQLHARAVRIVNAGDLDVESVLAVMENLVTEYDITGYARERSGSILPGIAPSNVYPCAGGEMILIGGNGDNVYARLTEATEEVECADGNESLLGARASGG